MLADLRTVDTSFYRRLRVRRLGPEFFEGRLRGAIYVNDQHKVKIAHSANDVAVERGNQCSHTFERSSSPVHKKFSRIYHGYTKKKQ